MGARSWAEARHGEPASDAHHRPQRVVSRRVGRHFTVPVTSPSGQTGVIAGRSLMGGIAARVAVLTSADASAVAVV